MKNLLQRLPFLNNPEPESDYLFDSGAEFSVHEVIEHLVKAMGSSSVRISSFSIGERTLRILHNLCESGLIGELSCLLDISVKRHKLGLLFFANNAGISISLAKNHAKIILIDNGALQVTIITSANMQVNDKNEVGIVSTRAAYFSYFGQVFDKWFESGLKITADDFK
jgi:hypothetical protein